ncbi:MAG: hypothetical protein N4A33_13125 [Bacteriovoracaceae bacterium]|nr:hypothetical protein [Bacteriovoracaceae bacterium]
MVVFFAFVLTFLLDGTLLYLFRSKYPFSKPSSLYKKVEYILGVLVLFVISFAVIRASLTYMTR